MGCCAQEQKSSLQQAWELLSEHRDRVEIYEVYRLIRAQLPQIPTVVIQVLMAVLTHKNERYITSEQFSKMVPILSQETAQFSRMLFDILDINSNQMLEADEVEAINRALHIPDAPREMNYVEFERYSVRFILPLNAPKSSNEVKKSVKKKVKSNVRRAKISRADEIFIRIKAEQEKKRADGQNSSKRTPQQRPQQEIKSDANKEFIMSAGGVDKGECQNQQQIEENNAAPKLGAANFEPNQSEIGKPNKPVGEANYGESLKQRNQNRNTKTTNQQVGEKTTQSSEKVVIFEETELRKTSITQQKNTLHLSIKENEVSMELKQTTQLLEQQDIQKNTTTISVEQRKQANPKQEQKKQVNSNCSIDELKIPQVDAKYASPTSQLTSQQQTISSIQPQKPISDSKNEIVKEGCAKYAIPNIDDKLKLWQSSVTANLAIVKRPDAVLSVQQRLASILAKQSFKNVNNSISKMELYQEDLKQNDETGQCNNSINLRIGSQITENAEITNKLDKETRKTDQLSNNVDKVEETENSFESSDYDEEQST